MGISISGSNAISGLGGNDTDFDKVLENLKKIESTQLNKLEAWKSDWKLRYDAFSEIITQIQAASSMLSQISDKNSFVTKNVVSSNDHIVTAVANASAQDVSHTINVKQTASQAIWANTGHIFASKNDIINTTGSAQMFRYSYAGKYHEFKVPANTSLESFQSMINSSADNPGIKVSLVQTGNGYVFQIAGKETGAKNDLIIYDSNLVGMQNTAGTSTNWISNNAVKPADNLSDPTSFTFDITLDSGVEKELTIKGDATAQDLVDKLNNLGGITASVDASGQLTLKGVKSFSRRETSDNYYTPASTRLSIGGDFKDASGAYVKLNADGAFAGYSDSDKFTFTVTMDDGSKRNVEVEAGATKRDLYLAIAQATQDGDSVDVGVDNSGAWGVNLKGVKNVEITQLNGVATSMPGAMNVNTTAASGVQDTLGGALSADTKITFENSKLGDRIDGKAAGDPATDLVYSIIDAAGNEKKIKIKSDKTNQDLLNELKAAGLAFSEDTTTDPAKTTLTLNGVREFRLSYGGVDKPGYTSAVEATVVIDATNSNPGPTSTGDLFYRNPADGSFGLEKAPDLVYEITTNDGKKGTLTLPSGSTMQNVLFNLKNTGGANWVWKDSSGNPTTPPATLGVRYTDKDGKEYLKSDGTPMTTGEIGDQPIYINFKDVQEASGPGLKGQISESSNWSIQRSSNAIYTVDNWPVEMESETNTVSDTIEGVVISIQEAGEAKISISTDITSVEQSIQNFLDAVNSVLVTVNNLMKYDEAKEVTSNDPNDIGNDNYSASGLTNQKGNLLTGNYGVQLFKSRFTSLLATTPPGFQQRKTADDVLSGDVLASLANMGIKTDTDTTSDTYGLLVLAPSSSIAELQNMDKENYNNLITNNLEAVVDFFCNSGSGSTTSPDFRYGSHIAGITKAGVYDVTYDVDASGNISNVKVGGVEATRDSSMPGNYYSVGKGDAKGLSILIDNLDPGPHEGQVRIKQGLVQTTNEFLKAELVFNDVNISANSTPEQIADAVALKSKNGALMSLRDNYMKVMESIDVKIEREQRRIDTWYNRQKTIFANLETLLKQYSQQQESLESQIKQLGGNS